MDDFLIGPQSDEYEYTWWDYEMECGDDDLPEDDIDTRAACMDNSSLD